MSTVALVIPREGNRDANGNVVVTWAPLDETAEAGWQRALGSRAWVQALGDFGVIEIEGSLTGQEGQRIHPISKAAPLWYLHAVPLYVRPVIKGGEQVTVLMYFMRP